MGHVVRACGGDEVAPAPLAALLDRRQFIRVSALVAGSIAALPLLAACGGDDDDADEESTTPSGDAPTSTPAGGAGSPVPATTAPSGATATTAGDAPTEAPTSPATGRGGDLIVIVTSDADTLDPHHFLSGPTYIMLHNLFDSLIGRDADLGFEPLIAESWEVSDDGMNYTFTIHDGMTFHDGSPVNAEAVKFTFDRALNPESPAKTPSLFEPITGTELVDDRTVMFILSQPSGPFLTNLSSDYLAILPPGAVDELGDEFGQRPVGSGPWMFQEWITAEQLTFVPFPDYQNVRSYVENKGAPLADKLIFRVIPEAATQIVAFQTGEANIMTLPTNEVENFQDDPDYNVIISQAANNISYIEFAVGEGAEAGEAPWKPPFDDLRVRQAVGYALDVDAIIEGVFSGLAARIYGPIGTAWFAYDPAIEEFGFHYEPERANALLDEAGWVDSNGDGVRERDGQDLVMEFWVSVSATNERVAQVIQNQLGEVGMRVELQVLDVGTLLARLKENEHDLNTMGMGWSEPDVLLLITGFDWGFAYYRPEEYVALLTEARETSDQEERKRLYFEASKMILEDAAIIPLWSTLSATATRSEVKGFKLDPTGTAVYEDAYIAE